MLWFHQLQNIIGIPNDAVMLRMLRISSEIREFWGFTKVPHEAQITRFCQNFVNYLGMMFDNLVEITEPVCHELDSKKADYLLYNTTGIEVNVAQNNPKFMGNKLSQAKKSAKKNSEYDPYKGVYALLPETAKANPFVKHQHINGNFCYAHKAGIFSNGSGIVRHISVFDEDFKQRHSEIITHKTDNPTLDKEIGDSTLLKPILLDFFISHPHFLRNYSTFLADSSFDSYDNYTMLNRDFHFRRICIPLNPRNSKSAHICPLNKTPFTFLGISGGKNRSKRSKFFCHKSVKAPKSTKRICTCDTTCTTSSYGRCGVYS